MPHPQAPSTLLPRAAPAPLGCIAFCRPNEKRISLTLLSHARPLSSAQARKAFATARPPSSVPLSIVTRNGGSSHHTRQPLTQCTSCGAQHGFIQCAPLRPPSDQATSMPAGIAAGIISASDGMGPSGSGHWMPGTVWFRWPRDVMLGGGGWMNGSRAVLCRVMCWAGLGNARGREEKRSAG
ncbi:hypothetical protein VTJ83DRAFT_5993 [Remersonia thermophila]|uniref:Uncharacterized protein n=1 Tax=Remersonia thermophila TaxID=72144 RepID=A0ABR4D8J8_9PEZI